MEDLPEGFDCVRGPAGILALSRELAPALRAAGYGLEGDGSARPSPLSGRRPLLELRTTAGVFLIRKLTHGGLLRFLTRDRFSDRDRPFRELRVAERLARAGVGTPQVAAARARAFRMFGLRLGPLFGWRLDIVTRRIEGGVDLDEILDRARKGSIDRRTVARVAAAFGKLVGAMHAAGCSHADLTTKNALVVEDSLAKGRPEAAILDLDRARVGPLSLGDRRRNLARLARYVDRRERERGRGLSRTDRARFLGAYESDRSARRAHAKAVLEILARGRVPHALGRALEGLFG